MKQLACGWLLILTILALGANASAQNQSALAGAGPETLTNESIINLAKAHFKEHTIILLIHSSPTAFDLSAAKLIELKQCGVSERVMMEMVKRQFNPIAPQDRDASRDHWYFTKEDEEFFNSVPSFEEALGGKPAKPSKTPVFISHSDSKSATRSQRPGSNKSRQSESELASTATVSLIQPPTKEGVPKLERAPKLDNKAIIEMMAAGFSEGAILRNIETMQVAFDTSSKALAKLRENRVSERIIQAMTEAMSEGPK